MPKPENPGNGGNPPGGGSNEPPEAAPLLPFIDTISDSEGVNGNAGFVSFVPGPIVHRFELATKLIEIPAFGGLTADSVDVLKPSNDRYRSWLNAIATRVDISINKPSPRKKLTVEVSDEGVAVTFWPGSSTPILDATWVPTRTPSVELKGHSGGVFSFPLVYKWAEAIAAFIKQVQNF